MDNNENVGKITLGISACLTGQEVRYDKSHKKSAFCMDELSKHVQFKTFCPEVAIGMPVPRATVRQIQREDIIHVSRPDGSSDVTDALNAYSEKIAKKMSHLTGFIFTAKSPSCGMERVKVYFEHGKGSLSTGVGLFAQAVMKANPLMPCEENGRLNDPVIRENFILRLYAYKKWQNLLASGLTKHKLFQFHSQYKYLLMSHHSKKYVAIGRLLAQSDKPLAEIANDYVTVFMDILKQKASKKSHSNTLQHIQGYFSKKLNSAQKQELTDNIHDYRKGLVPLMVPLTLLKHYLVEFPNKYLAEQAYFSPYPAQLKLRYGY